MWCGYKIYLWTNENNEPIHVHISKGKPSSNSTKVWITKAGQCILANNNSRIPESDLKELFDAISTQYFVIVKRWKEVFNTDEVKYYC